jgi:uncharacterized protein (TIGR02145 family)
MEFVYYKKTFSKIVKATFLFIIMMMQQNCVESNKYTNNAGGQELNDNDTSALNKVFLIDSLHVKIGDQTWCLYNLDVTNYRNGDQIRNLINIEDWKYAQDGAWCVYENMGSSRNGKLYNFMAVRDPRGLAPIGYHIPTAEEWTTLIKFLKDNKTESSLLKKYFFDGITGVWRTGGDGAFDSSTSSTTWWSSSDAGSYAYSFSVNIINQNYSGDISDYSMPPCGLYVRCIKDYNTKP